MLRISQKITTKFDEFVILDCDKMRASRCIPNFERNMLSPFSDHRTFLFYSGQIVTELPVFRTR
jgi:hypothetical protein